MESATTTATGALLDGTPLILVFGIVICISFTAACMAFFLFRQFAKVPPVLSPPIAITASSETLGQKIAQQDEAKSDMRAAFHRAHFPAWLRKRDGTVIWSNAALRQLSSDDAGHAGDAVILPASFWESEDINEPISDRRVSISLTSSETKQRCWFKVSEIDVEDDQIFGYAIDANELIGVETTLNRFISTLTESFAQLSTGLAIFSADRRMTMFNPAIADLMRLDPGWLATGPTFRDFMNRIREQQMIPEQKTPADWRAFVQTIEDNAKGGILSEKWVLSSGQTLQITGKPHPHGALALMIEDITSHIQLERRYRSGVEQTRATLDQLSEAVCIFDTAGNLEFHNAAFETIWDLPPEIRAEGMSVVQLTSLCSANCKPTPAWGDLREFVTSIEQRASWSADIDLLNGDTIAAVFAPLPDGSTLVAFSGSFESANRSPKAQTTQMRGNDLAPEVSVLELAIEHMQEVVRSIAQNGSAVEQDDKGLPVRSANAADVANYTDRLLQIRRDENDAGPDSEKTLQDKMVALLEEKEAKLTLSCENVLKQGNLTSDVKRVLINVVLVARALVKPNENVDISIAEMDEGVSISCLFRIAPEFEANPEENAGLTYRIMMRFLKDRQGHGEICALDERGLTQITCTIPVEATGKSPKQLQA